VAVIGSRLEVTAPLADYDAAVERVEKIAAALGVELRRGPYGAPMGSYGQATVSHNIPLPAPITAFLDQHRRGSYTDLLPFDPARPFDPAQPLKMVITGKMASGKGAASGHLVERYGAKRMPREDIIKPFVYGIAEGDPATPERLAELFPDDQSVRSGLEQEIGRYMKSYVDEGGKRRRLLQDVIDFVQQRNAYAIEEALNRRIAAAAADAPFVIIDDVRPLEAFDYFKGQGYITVRIEASRRIREQRMLERDGVIPPDEAFQHWTETALDGVPHDFVIYNETNDPEALTCKLDAVLERITLRQQAAA
jgi:dephospho-CoA kinase